MADTKYSALTAATALDGTEVLAVEQSTTSVKVTTAQLGLWYAKALASDVANSTVTTAKVTGLDTALPVGTYQFQYFIRWQTAAITTGISLNANFSGTVTSFVWNMRYVDVSATASTAAPSQSNIQAAAGVMGAFSSRAKATTGRGTLLSVDAATSDMLAIIEGIAVVSVAGNMELWSASEVAASAATVKSGSSLACLKVG